MAIPACVCRKGYGDLRQFDASLIDAVRVYLGHHYREWLADPRRLLIDDALFESWAIVNSIRLVNSAWRGDAGDFWKFHRTRPYQRSISDVRIPAFWRRRAIFHPAVHCHQ